MCHVSRTKAQAHHQSSHHVSSQVNTQDGDSSQRQGDINDDEQQEGSDLWDVACQSVGNGLFQIIKDQTAWRITKRLVSRGVMCLVRVCIITDDDSDDVVHSPTFFYSCDNRGKVVI